MRLEFFFDRFPKIYSNIKFHENPSIGIRVVTCGQTDGQNDMSKLIVAFRNFVNAPKNVYKVSYVNNIIHTIQYILHAEINTTSHQSTIIKKVRNEQRTTKLD
jgi:hypothetical protein